MTVPSAATSWRSTFAFVPVIFTVSVDGLLTLAQHVMVRNVSGSYGDVEKVPFVSERGGPEALKSFAFLLLQLSQSFIGQPFGLTDYQHL